MSAELDAAYQYCLDQSRAHYENFPVASWFLPAHLRKHVAAIYVFSRRADDLADEGTQHAQQRLSALQSMQDKLIHCTTTTVHDAPLWLALADTIRCFSLPLNLFQDLIDAFSQDVTQKRYSNYNELINYCRRSANPIGRLMLHLQGRADADACRQSDSICTALQLINFYQDLAQDYAEMGRIYIPQQECVLYNVTEQHFAHRISDSAMQQLMSFQYQRTEKLLQQGKPLGQKLSARFGFEIRLIIAGAERMLHKLQKQQHVFSRPRLHLGDKLWMLQRAIIS